MGRSEPKLEVSAEIMATHKARVMKGMQSLADELGNIQATYVDIGAACAPQMDADTVHQAPTLGTSESSNVSSIRLCRSLGALLGDALRGS